MFQISISPAYAPDIKLTSLELSTMPFESTLAIRVKNNPTYRATIARDGNLLLSDLSNSCLRIYTDVTETSKSENLSLEFVLEK